MPAFLVGFLFWLMRTTREEWLAKREAKRAPAAEAVQQSPA